tara:strand:+ start:392 stop:526 length:135 start_codon:yes stop_codon:yes gene_type:complete
VYYLNPSTPNKLKKYIKQGVDDWKKKLKPGVSKISFWQNTHYKR